jgi:hypothetical protein
MKEKTNPFPLLILTRMAHNVGWNLLAINKSLTETFQFLAM